uniref:Uncharacterized protein n=1 Tax=Ixodes ricinus TaxID=34613 RepID=A0A6B0UIC9_IXORI
MRQSVSSQTNSKAQIDPPSTDAIENLGLTDLFTKAELIAAIEAAKKHSSPGYDSIAYVLNEVEGFRAINRGSGLHSKVTPIRLLPLYANLTTRHVTKPNT